MTTVWPKLRAGSERLANKLTNDRARRWLLVFTGFHTKVGFL